MSYNTSYIPVFKNAICGDYNSIHNWEGPTLQLSHLHRYWDSRRFPTTSSFGSTPGDLDAFPRRSKQV